MTPTPTAAIDPWLLLALSNGETALFGYCLTHHRLGGLSWVLSSPLLSLDETGGAARTRSGTHYLLGCRIEVGDLPDDEARASLESLTGGNDTGSGSTRAWLAACKTARWLRLPGPPRSDAAAVEAFLGMHRTAYLALRRKARAAALRGAVPGKPGPSAAGKPIPCGVDDVGDAVDASFAPSPTKAGAMFRAMHRQSCVTIGRADRDELLALADGGGSECRRDAIDTWSLIAIRGLARGTRVHALGWRVGLANNWITSPIARINLGPLTVSTVSGHAYRLMSPEGAKLRPALREHLCHALHCWGFHDIQQE